MYKKIIINILLETIKMIFKYIHMIYKDLICIISQVVIKMASGLSHQ